MRILFVHQNFPGQFKHLAPALAEKGHEVVALCMRKEAPPSNWRGVRIISHQVSRGSTPKIHPWLADLETKVIRGEATFWAAKKLEADGFTPDLIIAHPGWGESLFLRDLWPAARLALYCEFYYREKGADVDFDPEFAKASEGAGPRLRMKNANNTLHFETADAGLSPTHWQASTFPEAFRSRIRVIHDGIDTDTLVPNPTSSMNLKRGDRSLRLSCDDEVITFVNRNLEPYRGFHIFMRSLPELLRRRPQAHVLIVGKDEVSYGARAPNGRSWRDHMMLEVKDQIKPADWERVHFVGQLPYPDFVNMLRISTVHVYLTYPFVLSWSLLEAMSIGCTIVASDTAPLKEAIQHDKTGKLVDFFDGAGLVRTVCDLLEDPAERARLSEAARAFARENYDLQRHCLPKQLEWVDELLEASRRETSN